MARQDPLRAAGHARGPYIATLASIQDPEPFLLEHSGLPGRRANLELAFAAGEVLAPATLRRFAALDASAAPTGEAREFLALCGVIGLGRLLAEGDASSRAPRPLPSVTLAAVRGQGIEGNDPG